jgi:hypothetical protein
MRDIDTSACGRSHGMSCGSERSSRRCGTLLVLVFLVCFFFFSHADLVGSFSQCAQCESVSTCFLLLPVLIHKFLSNDATEHSIGTRGFCIYMLSQWVRTLLDRQVLGLL